VKNPLAQPMLELIANDPDGVGVTADLAEKLGRAPKVIAHIATNLKRRGLIESPQPGRYQMTQTGRDWLADGKTIASGQGKKRVRTAGGLRERAWWLMRQTRRFTIADLLDTLADGSERDARSNLTKYVRALERAGIVQRMRRKVPGFSATSPGAVLWMLKLDLGRKAPVWRMRKGEIYDTNQCVAIPFKSPDVEVSDE